MIKGGSFIFLQIAIARRKGWKHQKQE